MSRFRNLHTLPERAIEHVTCALRGGDDVRGRQYGRGRSV